MRARVSCWVTDKRALISFKETLSLSSRLKTIVRGTENRKFLNVHPQKSEILRSGLYLETPGTLRHRMGTTAWLPLRMLALWIP